MKYLLSLSAILLLFYSMAKAQNAPPLYFGFENPPELESQYWEVLPNFKGENGLTDVANGTGAAGSSYFVRMGKNSEAGGMTTNALNLKVDMSGQQGKQLEFSFAVYFFEDETQFGDGIFMSDNGGASFKRVIALEPQRWCNQLWGGFKTFDLDKIMADNQLKYTSNFIIQFRHEGSGFFSPNSWQDRDGMYIDEIYIQEAASIIPAKLPFRDGFKDGKPAQHWSFPGTKLGTQQTNAGIPIAGSSLSSYLSVVNFAAVDNDGYSLFMGKWVDCNGQNINQANLHLNLSGHENSDLTFSFAFRYYFEETQTEDAIYMSDDGGVTFKRVIALEPQRWEQNQAGRFQPFDLDEIIRTNGLRFSSNFIIQFSQIGDGDFLDQSWNPRDGFWIDDVRVDVLPRIVYKKIPFCENFDNNPNLDHWRVVPARLDGDQKLIEGANPFTVNVIAPIFGTGSNGWHLGKTQDPNGFCVNGIDLHLDCSNTGKVALSFDIFEAREELQDEDGIWLSVNGGQTFTKIYDFNWAVIPDVQYTKLNIPISDLAAAKGIQLSGQTIVRIQQAGIGNYDSSWSGDPSDGVVIDNVCLSGTVSTHSPGELSTITVFPNPTPGPLQFSQSLHRVIVRNTLGQLVLTAENISQTDLSALSEGVYWVEMQLEENAATLVKRVVIKR